MNTIFSIKLTSLGLRYIINKRNSKLIALLILLLYIVLNTLSKL